MTDKYQRATAYRATKAAKRGPGTVRRAPAKTKRKSGPAFTLEQLAAKCRTYRSASQLATALRVSRRTIERRLNDARAAGVVVEVKQAWDGDNRTNMPQYRIASR